MSVDTSQELHLPLSGLLEIAFEALLDEFREDLEAAGYADIRPGHGCVFRFVRGDGLRLTELAGLAGMTKQSVGEVVDDLVDLGYVERVPDPADRRAKLIRLTGRGTEAQAVGFGLFAGVEKRWSKRYGADRIAQLRETLEAIAAAEAPDAVPELSRPALVEA
ncbi:MAG TPA: MarR family transcriptional regulator [Solirubrobacterales bacterium]|jgi:DNA-binding MarR family transcriptional regulator|nr:MarR family transcriptional regulator [Solirubrobacterales bacterium]